MSLSLSIVLPVYNHEALLAAEVDRLLEMLSDLAPPFELLIVDDGSTDQTAEVARDLACRYPQVRFVCHGRHQGIPAAVQTGLAEAQGKTVVVHEAQSELTDGDIRRYSELPLCQAPAVVRLLPRPRPLDAETLSRLAAWGAGASAEGRLGRHLKADFEAARRVERARRAKS